MNKKEAAQVLAILKAGYPNHYRNITDEDAMGVISLWSMQFADMSAEIVFMALNKAINTSKYPPTIAEVKEKISSVHWEVYEILESNYRHKNLSDGELKLYQRIYEGTQGYKFSGKAEPSIRNMLTGNKGIKLIE